MPMFEYDGHTDAFSTSHPSPRCAGACCPDPRLPAGCAMQRHSPGDSPEMSRMLGRAGPPEPSRKGPVLLTPHIFFGMFMAIPDVQRGTKPPFLKETGAHLKKTLKKSFLSARQSEGC